MIENISVHVGKLGIQAGSFDPKGETEHSQSKKTKKVGPFSNPLSARVHTLNVASSTSSRLVMGGAEVIHTLAPIWRTHTRMSVVLRKEARSSAW